MCYTHTHTHTHTHTRTHQAPATICSWSRGSIALRILLPFPTFLPTILLNIPRPIAFVFQHKRRRVSIVSSEGAGKSRGFTSYGRHTPPSNDPAHGVWGWVGRWVGGWVGGWEYTAHAQTHAQKESERARAHAPPLSLSLTHTHADTNVRRLTVRRRENKVKAKPKPYTLNTKP